MPCQLKSYFFRVNSVEDEEELHIHCHNVLVSSEDDDMSHGRIVLCSRTKKYA